MKRLHHILTFSIGCIILAACGGPPANNPLLKEAQRDYHAAANNPDIVANAPVALKQADVALNKSESLLQQGADEDEVTHYAYLAKQRTEIAKEKAKQHAAEEEIEHAKLERKEVLLKARENEVEQSQLEAKQAKQNAEAAKQQAAEAKEDAQAAKEDLTEARMTAEAAKAEAREKAREAEAAKAAAAAALAGAQALADSVAELNARQTERGLVITLSDILFDFDKATLKSGADRALNKVAGFLDEYEKRNILIEGFTDNVGKTSYNVDLSQRRANAVRDALISKGISQSRIRTNGLGEEYPVATNDTEAGRQQNRRVEIVISDESGKIPGREN